MDDQAKDQLLHSVARVCVEQGLDCAAFIELMRAGFDVGIANPGQALSCHLTRFLFTSLQWACPPVTPDTERRRKEAEVSWACWTELNEQRIRASRQRPAA